MSRDHSQNHYGPNASFDGYDSDLASAGILIESLQQQLAAEQAYSAKLLGELESTRNGLLWWMDAFPLHVTEADHEEMAKLDQVLAIPHDDTALREWGARLLDWTFSKGMGGTLLLDTARQLRSGEWKP